MPLCSEPWSCPFSSPGKLKLSMKYGFPKVGGWHSTEVPSCVNIFYVPLKKQFNTSDYNVILFCSFRTQDQSKTIQCIIIPVYGDKIVVHQEVELLREYFSLPSTCVLKLNQ